MQDNTRSASDLMLWHRFQAGQGAALEVLMTSYFRTLFEYGTKFTRDEDFVKDCIQDLFLDLWHNRQTLNGEVNVKAYLLASLRRRIYRSSKNQARLPLQDSPDPPLEFALELSVEDKYLKAEAALALTREIKAHVENLPRRQREAVYLKFFENLDRDQIAQVMGIQPQSVSNLLQLAIQDLKANFSRVLLALILPLLHP